MTPANIDPRPAAPQRDPMVTRLYLKLLGSVLLVLALVYGISNYYMSQVGSQVAMGNLRERFRPVFSLTEDILLPLPPDQWAARFRQASARFGYEAELVELPALKADFSLSTAIGQRLDDGHILILGRDQQMLSAKRIGSSNFALLLHLPGINNARYYTDAGYFTLWIALFAILIGVWLIPYRRDLNHMNHLAERVGQGDFDARANLPRGSALFALAESFNAMASRIGHLVSSHKELTNAVSHELRNPLMRLRFRHQLANEVEDLDEKDRNLDLMAEDLDQLDHLADELLTYAKLERLEPEIRFEQLDPTEFLEKAVGRARELALAQNKTIALDFQTDHKKIQGEPRYLARAIDNLLSNAVRHASREVSVSLRTENKLSRLSVEDDGPGIAAEDRARVFEPFARTDEARARNTGGFGMGLAITRRIARWHGGEIHVESAATGGARFVMSW